MSALSTFTSRALAFLAGMGVAACDTTGPVRPSAAPTPPTATTATAAPAAAAAPAAKPARNDWGWQNFTAFPAFVSTFEKQGQTYLALSSKVSFIWDGDGDAPALRLASEQAPMQVNASANGMDSECEAHGASLNDRTTDYPYTAILVRGGELTQVRSPRSREAITLRALSYDDQNNQLSYTGPGRFDPEYAYGACIGEDDDDDIDSTHRLDHYLAADGVLQIERNSDGKPRARPRRLTLNLDGEFAPFLMLHYRDGAIVPSPTRIVLATVDVAERRLTLHYRSLLSESDALARIEYRAVLPARLGGRPSASESAARYAERSKAMLADLRQCPPLTRGSYSEACASPSRAPNPLIFSPSKP